jgi:O-antigen/teichoic acid export membrane protein
LKLEQIRLNALTTLAQVIGSAGVLFLLYRFLIRTIGVERLGIWSLVLATTSVVTLANQGFSTSIVKFVAKYVAREESANVSALLQTALISLAVTLGILSVALFPVAKWGLALVLPASRLAEAGAILPYAFVSLWANLAGSILQAGLGGYELITLRNYVVLGGSFVYLFLAFALVPRYGLAGLAYSQVVQAAACLAASWILLQRRLPCLPLWPHRWSRALFREMWRYGVHFQLVTISQAVREPVTKALLAKFGGLELTGYYDMALRWVVTFRELIVQANQVLVPTISGLQEREPRSIPFVYRESYRVIFFLALPAFAFLAAVSPVVALVWIGRYEPIFVRFVVLLAVGWLVNVLSNPAYVVDLGTGALRWVSIGCVSTAALNMGFGFLAGKYAGGPAIVGAYAFSLAAGYATVVVAYHVENRVSFRQLVPNESMGIILCSFAGAAVFLPFLAHSAENSGWSLRTSAGLSAAVLAMIALPMWFHPMRRRLAAWVLSRLPA